MPTSEQQKEWNNAFCRIKQVDTYENLKIHVKHIDNQIEILKEEIQNTPVPTNKKEFTEQKSNKVKYVMLRKQKIRLERKLEELHKEIQTNLQYSNKEL